jgi:hypothetical protein
MLVLFERSQFEDSRGQPQQREILLYASLSSGASCQITERPGVLRSDYDGGSVSSTRGGAGE